MGNYCSGIYTLNTGGIENIKNFDQLFPFLRDELGWPISECDFEIDDLTYEWDAAKDFGLKDADIAHIREIRQLRPLATNQPWGIFFVNFEDQKIPVGVLKRILGGLTLKKRQSANSTDQKGWSLHDLLFISATGASGERQLSFLHFAEEIGGKNKIVLKELGWDKQDTATKQAYVYHTLKNQLAWPKDKEGFSEWTKAFSTGHGEVIATSKILTKRLAELASGIRKEAGDILAHESKNGPLTKIFEDFQKTIFHNLTPADFVDMYAQTICYGLLSARIMRSSGTLVADDAALIAPLTQPFLKDLMETFLAVGGRKSKIDFNELGVNEVVELLQATDMAAVLRDFGNRNPHEDPILHFYEHFLKDYDAIMREQRGVYYTPLPVVRFIVRSVDEILQNEFGLADGLADTSTWGDMHANNPEIHIPENVSQDAPFVQILDPATGTGTFLVETIGLIEERMKGNWHKSGKSTSDVEALWNEYVPQHLLPRLNGFELMMAPYAIAHIKIGMKLHETGYSPNQGKGTRVRVYLTNTLEEPINTGKSGTQASLSLITDTLALEAKGADDIKTHTPITVVIGNPPYSGHSANASKIKNRLTFIGELLRPYFTLNGQPLNEKNSKWLNDDYVKFIRYGQWRIENSAVGILGYITNNGYLDNPTFRGMRESLLSDFEKMWLLDLHGSAKKKETAPDGSKDENVFNIMQGVSIMLGVGKKGHRKIWHSDLYGTRTTEGGGGKYNVLGSSTPKSLSWDELNPSEPFNMLVPRDEMLAGHYNEWEGLPQIMPSNVLGFQSHRDHLAVDFDRQEITNRLEDFRDMVITDDLLRQKYNIKDSPGWKVSKARTSLRNDPDWERCIIRCAYRPFDDRFCSFHSAIMDRPRRELLDHVAWRNNLSLLVSRQQNKTGFQHVWVADEVAESCTVSNKTREGNYNFPLLLFPSATETDIRPNLSNSFTQDISAQTGLTYEGAVFQKQIDMGRCDLQKNFGPRDVFDYIYSVLHSPAYRSRYADFLKSDFPRIPLPGSADLFRELTVLGRHLVDFQLLNETTQKALVKPDTRFVGKGEARVEKGYPKYENGKVIINPSCHFEDVTPDVWGFYTGGYQVCEKWLKERAGKGGKNPSTGRILSDDDILHYRRITIAIRETISLMKQIDEVIAKHGDWPNAFYVPPPPPPTIEEIIQADESRELEFKSTFQWDVRENKQNKELRKSVLKTLAAFMNSEGGTLVIGVTDGREIHGLEDDLKLTKNSTDVFEQTLLSVFGNTIGTAYAHYCKIRIVDAADDKKVCVIDVEPSSKPAFLTFQGKEEFFIRRGNATISLSPQEQHEYVGQRFG